MSDSSHQTLHEASPRGSEVFFTTLVRESPVTGLSSLNGLLYVYPLSGKQPHNYGKSPLSISKLAIPMCVFNSKALVITRGYISHIQRFHLFIYIYTYTYYIYIYIYTIYSPCKPYLIFTMLIITRGYNPMLSSKIAHPHKAPDTLMLAG